MSTENLKVRGYGSIEEEAVEEEPVHLPHGGDLPGGGDGRKDEVSAERRRALEEVAAAARSAELEGLE